MLADVSALKCIFVLFSDLLTKVLLYVYCMYSCYFYIVCDVFIYFWEKLERFQLKRWYKITLCTVKYATFVKNEKVIYL